ncbi:MAG: hypothetical protein RLZ98_2616 [Pseudomonadota bacterium]
MARQKRAGSAGAKWSPAGRRQHPTSQRPKPDTTSRAGAANARQRYQQYIALAEAAEKSGDKVTSESYYQHADHYYRMLNRADAGETA